MMRELITNQIDDDHDGIIRIEHHLDTVPTFVHVMPRTLCKWRITDYDDREITIEVDDLGGMIFDLFVIKDHSLIQ